MSCELKKKHINKLIEEKTKISLFLKKGVRLNGVIVDLGEVSLLLESPETVQLVFLDSISTIVSYKEQ